MIQTMHIPADVSDSHKTRMQIRRNAFTGPISRNVVYLLSAVGFLVLICICSTQWSQGSPKYCYCSGAEHSSQATEVSLYAKRTRFLVQRNQSTSGSWFSTNDTSELPEDATSDSSLDGPLPVAFQRTLKAYPVVPTTSVRIVLIVAYYRSGSSFFGELLSSGPKTYFHFEPLQPFTRAGGIRPGRQRLAFALLDELVRCRMYNAPLFTLWQENRSEYKHNRFLADVCGWGPSCSSPDHISALCSRAETQVFKFTRLSIAQVVAWINRNSEIAQQVQMVHLVRDPRGIYASRRNTSWCINAKECGSAKALCAQMRQDLDAFENLSGERWLNRKHRVRFEDVAADPVNETEALFSRLALEYGPSVTSFVKTHTVANEQHMNDRYSTKRNTKEIIRSWTKKLSKQDIGLVERYCGDILQRLGYTDIASEARIRN